MGWLTSRLPNTLRRWKATTARVATLVLLGNVGVNLLVVPAGVFFLSFAKGHIVGDAANSSVSPRILFGHLHWDTDWAHPNAARPIKLDVSCPDILFGFLHGISWIPTRLRCNPTPSKQHPYETSQDFHMT